MRISEALSARKVARPRPRALELPIQANPGRYGADGETRLINCYAEKAGKEAKLEYPIYAGDGLIDFATLTNGGACRGLFPTETRLYAVSGRQLFAVDPSGGATALGGVPGNDPVIFSRNRASPQQIVLTTGGLKFVITNATTLSEITDTDLPPASSNDFLDGYTLYFIADGRVFFSSSDAATTISATDFFEAEGDPDRLVRGIVHKRTIFLLGAETTELWDDVGDATTPFQRRPGGFLPFGCLSAGSVVKIDDNIGLIDDRGRVMLANTAGQTQRISHHAVERDIDALTDAQKALIEGFVYERRGHTFYVLSAATFTWVYDLITGLWHQRKSYQEDRWRAAYYAFFDGKHIVGDFENGVLYKLDPDTYDESGDHLIMTARFPIHAWPNPVNLKRLRFDMIPGVGLNTSTLHTSDPTLMVRLSKNGGKSWGNEMTRSIGKIGQYTATTAFGKGDGLGTSNEDGFVVEASVSAAVIRAFTGLSGEFEILRK